MWRFIFTLGVCPLLLVCARSVLAEASPKPNTFGLKQSMHLSKKKRKK